MNTRSAAKERTTKETNISVRIDLDGPTGEVRATTGLPFFDHFGPFPQTLSNISPTI